MGKKIAQNIAHKITGTLNPVITWIKTHYKTMIVLVLLFVVCLIIYRLHFKESFQPDPTIPVLTPSTINTTSLNTLKDTLTAVPNTAVTLATYNTLNFAAINSAITYFNTTSNFSIDSLTTITQISDKIVEINNNLNTIKTYLTTMGESVELTDFSIVPSTIDAINAKITNEDNISTDLSDINSAISTFITDIIITQIYALDTSYATTTKLLPISKISDVSSINRVHGNLQTALGSIDIATLRTNSIANDN